MENLKILVEQTTQLDGHVASRTFTSMEGSFVVVFDGICNRVYLIQDLEKTLLCTLSDIRTQPLSIKFIPETEEIVMCFESGELVTVTKEGLDERVGLIEDGIEAMAWSPDNELFVLATGAGYVLEMNRNFDVLQEFHLHVSVFGNEEMVNVGWGKKETQFHGSAGKQAAIPVSTVKAALSPLDDKKARLSWRFDGNFFVVSSVDPAKEYRVLRVFSREAALQSTSETVNQMTEVLCWRPAGNLIASVQVCNGRHDVIFFEKNGLRHGEFSLDSNVIKVNGLSWNVDSSILAVHVTVLNEAVKEEVLQLWTMSNYHYYLKQEIGLFSRNMQNTDSPSVHSDIFPTSFVWHDERSDHLSVTFSNGLHKSLIMQCDIDRSTSQRELNPGTVAVIDGKSLLLTPFKHANVPPPMARFTLRFKDSLSGVGFAIGNEGDDLCCWTRNELHLLKSNSIQPPISCHERLASYSLRDLYRFYPNSSIRSLIWLSNLEFLILLHGEHQPKSDALLGGMKPGFKDTLLLVKMEPNEDKMDECFAFPVDQPISQLSFNAETGECAVQCNDTVFMVDFESRTLQFLVTLPVFCSKIQLCRLQIGNENVVFALDTKRNKLYVQNHLLLSECEGFQVHASFLIATTQTKLLRFLPLTEFYSRLQFQTPLANSAILPHHTGHKPSKGNESIYDEYVRLLESGSRMVLAVPGSLSLVLQLPRGNLETVYPRALVLHKVRHWLAIRNFKEALLICRKHRLDLNLLHDHDPSLFASADSGQTWISFVTQIDNVEFLNLFISSIRNEDVSVSMYSRGTIHMKTPSSFDKQLALTLANRPGKTNLICVSLRKALESVDSVKFVSCILSTFVKQMPPDCESALRMIRRLKIERSLDEAEKALKYVIFLVNVDALYKVALGMYDFQLVLMVAQHSQKDPREYLPFLTELESLEKDMQRFRIDDYLGHHDEALKWLSCLGKSHFQHALEYTQKHNLYKRAMDIYHENPAELARIAQIYAESMLQATFVEEAATLFRMAGDFEAALTAYIQAGCWREAMCIVDVIEDGKRGCDENSLDFANGNLAETRNTKYSKVAAQLKAVLVDKKQFSDAARMFLDHIGDEATAVELLLQGCLFMEAIRVASKYGHFDWIQGKIKLAAHEEFNRVLHELTESKETFKKRLLRLETVRAEKMTKLTQEEWDPDCPTGNIDIMSNTSSMASSRMTAKSHATRISVVSIAKTAQTSRGRRKMEKKKSSSREGGLFEEDFLMTSMKELALRLDENYDMYQALIKSLLYFANITASSQLNSTYKETMSFMRLHFKNVFIYTKDRNEWPVSLKELKMFIDQNDVDDFVCSMLAPVMTAPILKTDHDLGSALL